MKRSSKRIITSHVGALPRPPGLPGLLPTSAQVPPVNVGAAVDGIVRLQIEHGVDIVGDGEFGKLGFLHYVRDRLSGMQPRELRPGEEHPTTAVARRDLKAFPHYFSARGGVFPFPIPVIVCAGDVHFVGKEAIDADIERLKAAMAKHGATEGFLTAISPQTVELVIPNEHYARQEDYLLALAEALHDEYKAITDAGLVLQVDDPGLAHAWQKDLVDRGVSGVLSAPNRGAQPRPARLSSGARTVAFLLGQLPWSARDGSRAAPLHRPAVRG